MPIQTALAIDVGRARVGVAYSSKNSEIALPLATFERTTVEYFAVSLESQLADISIEASDIGVIYVGLPLNLSGTKTASTTDAIEFAAQLSGYFNAEIRLIDERFSTTIANRTLQDSQRNQKQARSFIDQMAAIEILNHANAISERTGNPAGNPIDDWIE